MNYLKSSMNMTLSLSLAFLAACAQSSGSLKKYSELKKTMGPIHNSVSPVQTYLPSDLYAIAIDPATSSNFIVGQRNVLRIRTALNLPGTRYRLVSRDLPNGSEPLKDLGNGLWEFAWTPAPEVIPNNVGDVTQGGFHLALDIFEVTNPQSRTLAQSLSTEREFHYTLMRSNQAPEIIEITGVAPYPQATKINEGDPELKVSFIVKDPSSTQTQKPKLVPIVVPNRVSAEQRIISGHSFLFLETEPKWLKPGVWQFFATFDTKNNSVPEFNVDGKPDLRPSILANLSLQVLGANHTLSPEKTLSFEIMYRRELLKPAFQANPELQIVNQNSPWAYSFEVYLPSEVGTMTVYLNDETTKLPGTPKLTCRTASKNNQKRSCRIDWKIPCTVPSGDLTLTVIAAAEYQGQNTSTEFQKKLTIGENKKCQEAPTPAVARNKPESSTKKAATSKKAVVPKKSAKATNPKKGAKK